MNKIFKYFSAALIITIAIGCEDEEKDPFQFSNLKSGSILVLRGASLDNLVDSGCPDSFDPTNVAGETFDVTAEFLSKEVDALKQVKFFATRFSGGDRVEIKTVEGSVFQEVSGSKYRRGTISIPLQDILDALNIADPASVDFIDIVIEADIELTNGTLVPASSVANNGLFESTQFYPAHYLFYCAGD
jgi:hypothetical protein